MSRKPRTAAELMQELQSDPDDVSRRRARDERRREVEEELRAAEAPLVRELREAGVDVSSVWDLVNRAEPYPTALPILVHHLSRSYPDHVREGIARSLAVAGEADRLWGDVRRHYEREPVATRAKDGLAVALAALVDDERVGDLVRLLEDARHGESRVFFVRPVGESGHPRAESVLDDLTGDPHVAREIMIVRRTSR